MPKYDEIKAALVRKLESRDHENPDVALLGVREYWYEHRPEREQVIL